MRRSSTERPTFEVLIKNIKYFITDWVFPTIDEEHKHLEQLANRKYHPELIFQGESIINAAAVNPEALWKLKNLKKMPKDRTVCSNP